MTTRALGLFFLLLPGIFFQGAGNSQAQPPVSQQAQPGSGYAILFERMGGYTGRHDRYWIHLNGRVEDEGGIVRKIAPERVFAFRKGLEAQLPAATKAAPAKIGLCCDCYCYRITVPAGKGVRSVVLWEPLPVRTDKLARLVLELRDLVFGR
jgi:hypothetical protein